MEERLAETIEAAKRASVIKPSSIKRVIVDTTVRETAIADPTDSRMLERCREILVPGRRNRRCEGLPGPAARQHAWLANDDPTAQCHRTRHRAREGRRQAQPDLAQRGIGRCDARGAGHNLRMILRKLRLLYTLVFVALLNRYGTAMAMA